jgi:hypothetical protein
VCSWAEVGVVDAEVGQLGDAQSGVDGDQQQRVVATPDPG